MTEILDYLIQQSGILLEAPLLFILVSILAYNAAKWRYSRIIDILKAEKETDASKDESLKLLRNQGNEISDAKLFKIPDDGNYNYPYYKYFNQKIRKANEIYITGDGFDCLNKDGCLVARSFIESFRIALSNGATIIRIETKICERIEWARMLSDLKKDFDGSFQLYAIKNKNSIQMVNVSVTDPNDLNNCTVGMTLSTQRVFGGNRTNFSGTAIFITGYNCLATDLQSKILELRKPENSIHLETPLEIIRVLSGSSYYFSYGSNMDSSRMAKFCPSAEFVSIGVLGNYELVFNREHNINSGGVASIRKKENTEIHGVIWKVCALDLQKLDKLEPLDSYRRVQHEVNADDGRKYNCSIYVATPLGNFQPNSEYLSEIIKFAKRHNIPEEYISYLNSLKINA